jgi:hypothetical protein
MIPFEWVTDFDLREGKYSCLMPFLKANGEDFPR